MLVVFFWRSPAEHGLPSLLPSGEELHDRFHGGEELLVDSLHRPDEIHDPLRLREPLGRESLDEGLLGLHARLPERLDREAVSREGLRELLHAVERELREERAPAGEIRLASQRPGDVRPPHLLEDLRPRAPLVHLEPHVDPGQGMSPPEELGGKRVDGADARAVEGLRGPGRALGDDLRRDLLADPGEHAVGLLPGVRRNALLEDIGDPVERLLDALPELGRGLHRERDRGDPVEGGACLEDVMEDALDEEARLPRPRPGGDDEALLESARGVEAFRGIGGSHGSPPSSAAPSALTSAIVRRFPSFRLASRKSARRGSRSRRSRVGGWDFLQARR